MTITARMDTFIDAFGMEKQPIRSKGLFYGCDVKQLDIDVSPKGEITGYLTVFDWSDNGQNYVDPYNDIVSPGMFDTSYKALDRTRKARGDEYLCPSLYNHDTHQMIGGVTALSQDSKGYIYSSKLAMGLRKAQEVYELAKNKMIWASYGYTATNASKQGKYRILKAVDLHEQSYVTFPANALASIISTKHVSYPSVKDSGVWARLSPDSSPTNGLSDTRRWDALKPSSVSSEVTNIHWQALDPDKYTMGDLVRSVRKEIQE